MPLTHTLNPHFPCIPTTQYVGGLHLVSITSLCDLTWRPYPIPLNPHSPCIPITQYVGGLHLASLTSLRDLYGLGALTTVKGDLNIIFCPALTSTKGASQGASLHLTEQQQCINCVKRLLCSKAPHRLVAPIHHVGFPSIPARTCSPSAHPHLMPPL